MHTLSNQVAEGITRLDVAPSREQIKRRIAKVSLERWRYPVVGFRINGAYVPTQPARARELRPGLGRR